MQVKLINKLLVDKLTPLSTERIRNGFSLIELLVVVSIMGVLSTVLTANFMGMRERARDSQKIQDLSAMKSALRMYYNDFQHYPVGGGLDRSCFRCLSQDADFSNYMPSISSLTVGYSYSQIYSGDGFWLKVGLEAGSGDDDINSQRECGVVDSNLKNKVYMICAN